MVGRRLISGDAGARGRVRPAQRALRPPRPAVVRLLRPPPDRPADVARDRGPAGRPLLPRLRPDLLLPERAHGRVGDGRAVLRTSGSWRSSRSRSPRCSRASSYRYSHVAHPTLRDVQQKLADVATVAEENIVGVHVVKAFAQEPAEEAKFERALRGRLPADGRREPPARALRAADLVHPAARAGGGAPGRRADGRTRARSRPATSSPSTSTSGCSSGHSARSACGSARRSARPPRASASSR